MIEFLVMYLKLCDKSGSVYSKVIVIRLYADEGKGRINGNCLFISLFFLIITNLNA